jgi:CO/xanthine dehydrogenase Mo-binding subunit
MIMMGTIGDSTHRPDAPDKIGGRAAYIADMRFDGMLHARTLRSSRARARILSIELPAVPDGYFIVDRHDVPGANRVRMISEDQPLFAENQVRYIGEPILLVVGPDRERIDDILSGTVIGYEELPPVCTIEEAEKSGSEWCFVSYCISKGSPEQAFERARETFQGEYATGLQEHVYLEPQGVIGLYENGRVTVYGSMQCPYYVKNALVHALGLGGEKIRVVQTTTGGAFGGKEDYPSLIAAQVACAAIKTGSPVRLILDREEDVLCTTKRHPSVVRIQSAVDQRRRVTGMLVDITLDGGAYEGLSSVVLQRAMFAASGVYRVDDVRVTGRVLRTNTVPTGAFRGFGGPQAIFAIEMHMHSLARKLGEEPLDFKMRHLLRQGDTTVTGGSLRERMRMPEMVQRVCALSGYREKAKELGKKSMKPAPDLDRPHRRSEADWSKGGRLRGVGVSLFLHGCAFTGSGEKDKIKARVKLRKSKEGSVEILVSNVEFGQGPMTTLRKIVARTLGVPLQAVLYVNPDTDRVPDSGPTVASRTVMIVGKLLDRAARDLRETWRDDEEMEVTAEYEQPAHIDWNQEHFRGDAYPVYSWGTNVVEVEIDPVTCEITVTGVWGVYDVGRSIDERIVRGQMEGGVAQGLGYGCMEVMNSRMGAILQRSIADYVIPTAVDFPKTEIDFVHAPYEHGPYGAKCAGELPFVGAAPALAAAVQNAVGVRVSRIPVTPEYLQEILKHEALSER